MDIYRRQKRVETLKQDDGQHRRKLPSLEGGVEASSDPMLLATVSDDTLSASVSKAVRQKRYGLALHLLNQLIKRYPLEANYYSNRGLLHLWRGDLDIALDDCNYAIELAPGLDQAYNNRANCYAAMGLSVKALVDYERAVDLNPFNSRARINLGITLRSLGDVDAALECFDEALLFYKLLAFIYAERGRTHHLRGDWNYAIADYRRVRDAIPEGRETLQQKRLLKRVQDWVDELLPGQGKRIMN
jgi:tetratricopeptide (TPR) repeat protein